MSDIFVSYARADRDRVELLVQALEKRGWTIFLDRTIGTGEKYRETINSAIQACRCVLVVWTEQSVKSDWVLDEAERGKKKILVPVFLDEVELPLGFGAFQAANLVGWNGNESAPSLSRLISDIAIKLDRSGPLKPVEPHPPADSKSKQSYPATPLNSIERIAKILLDALISVLTKSAALVKRIVGTIVATFIISATIIVAREAATGRYFSDREVFVIGLMVLVTVLAVATILSWLKRRRNNGTS